MTEKETEKKNQGAQELLGYCYFNRSCTGGRVAEYPISLVECRDLGGRSWEDENGICHRL